jgi:hypothetical protein
MTYVSSSTTKLVIQFINVFQYKSHTLIEKWKVNQYAKLYKNDAYVHGGQIT